MEIKHLFRKFLSNNVVYTESNSVFNLFKKPSEESTKDKKPGVEHTQDESKNADGSSTVIGTPPLGSGSSADALNKSDEEKAKEQNFLQYGNTFDAPTALLFENLNKEYKYITTQDTFDGFRFEIDKNVNKYLQSTHSLFLGTSLRDIGYLYQFGANFTNADSSLLMISRINIDGTVNGRLCKKVTDEIDFKFNFNTFARKDTINTYETSIEVNKPIYAYSVKTVWQGTWIFNASYTQLLTQKLQAGVDLTYISANCASIGSMGLRYNHNNNVITMQATRQPNFKAPELMLNQVHAYKIQYAKKISDRLSLATELEITPETEESAMRVGWDYSFRHAKVQGTIDTSGKISVFTQDFSGFGISGFIDYLNNEYKFGFMMHISPSRDQPPQST